MCAFNIWEQFKAVYIHTMDYLDSSKSKIYRKNSFYFLPAAGMADKAINDYERGSIIVFKKYKLYLKASK